MQKVGLFVALLGTSTVLGQNAIGGYYVVGASPPASTSTCCYLDGPLTVIPTSATASTASSPVDTTVAAGCTTGYSGSISSNVLTQTVTTAAATSTTATGGAATATAGNDHVDYSLTGTTLSFTPTQASGGTACTAQTLTRTGAAGVDGTWTAGATSGTNAANCCFLQSDITIATASGLTTATGKYAATGCTNNGGTYSKLLTPGTGSGKANAIGSTTETFTVNADGSLTYTPAANCAQAFAKSSSSAVSLATAMTPVVVGIAAMGLVL